jgi:hypothetical protein
MDRSSRPIRAIGRCRLLHDPIPSGLYLGGEWGLSRYSVAVRAAPDGGPKPGHDGVTACHGVAAETTGKPRPRPPPARTAYRGDGPPASPPSAAGPRPGRRTALTFPLPPPPRKNRSPPSDSSPDTPVPGGISSVSRTSPVRGSTRLRSLSSPSQVPCHSSPSIQVRPVTTRLDSMVRGSAPVSGSI